MTHGLCRPGPAVELAFDYRPYDPDLLLNPRAHGEIGRIYFHELLHFWQVFSQSYITQLTAIETIEVMRHVNPSLPEPLRDDVEGRFIAVHPISGFSAYHLSEALCRFWDVEVVGSDIVYEALTGERVPGLDESTRDPVTGNPATDSKMARLAMMAEDQYAEPYRMALANWGEDAYILFPLVAHCCLQTRYPIDLYAVMAQRRIVWPRRRYVTSEPPWFTAWPFVRDLTNAVAFEMGIESASATHMIETSILADRANFSHYLLMLNLATMQWGQDFLDYAFAAPGRERSVLGTILQPAATLLQGGHWPNSAPLEFAYFEAIGRRDEAESQLGIMADNAIRLLGMERDLKKTRLLDRKRRALAGEDAIDIPQVDTRLWTGRLSPSLEVTQGYEAADTAEPAEDPPPPEWDAFPRIEVNRQGLVDAAVKWLLEQLKPGMARIFGRPTRALCEAQPEFATRLEQLHGMNDNPEWNALGAVQLNPSYVPHRQLIAAVASFVWRLELYEEDFERPLACVQNLEVATYKGRSESEHDYSWIITIADPSFAATLNDRLVEQGSESEVQLRDLPGV